MRKIILFLVVCHSAMYSSAQTSEEKVLKSMCDCLTVSVNIQNGIDDKKFEDCWNNVDTNLVKEIMSMVQENNPGAGSYEDGYAFGKKFFEKNQVRLIYTCDAWYHFIDSSRYAFFSEINPNELLLTIDSLSALIGIRNKESDLYRQRGLAYFSLHQLENAKNDFDKALSLPQANSQNLYFRGWVAEFNGNFDEALVYYKRAREESGIVYIDSLIAIAERKKEENRQIKK